MTQELVITIGRDALLLILMVSSPMLGFGLVVGVTIAIFQAVTQINEITITFVPKIVALALALLLFLPWIINSVVDFTNRMYAIIPTLSG
ncbi:MAG: flagellar biosynthesis protein FliQ [candidate division Zixibacteria bacterium]|nr:flagellar biosynthesis protein FliQ [candidate division Zixibacteria bacterium]